MVIFGMQSMYAQNKFDLKFDQLGISGSEMQVKLSIKASDDCNNDFRLGSSNLRFKFNNDAILNPQLESALAFTGNAATDTYRPMEIIVTYDAVCVNIVKNGGSSTFGGPIGEIVEKGVWTEFAIINFTVVNNSYSPQFSWQGTNPANFYPTTVVFLDDETTILGAGDLINIGPGPLPIDLVAFDAEWENEQKTKGLISWTVASQIDNAFFTIEKSHDNVNWSELANVDGDGTFNGMKSYSVIDENPFGDITYYRLKQTDFVGQFEIYDPVFISKDAVASSLKLFPNPAEEVTFVEIYSEINTSANIIITDLNGKILMNRTERLFEGLNKIKLNVGQLEAASYSLRVVSNKSINYKMLIKQ